MGVSQGISSNTLSDGCRKFLQAAYDKWASENKCQLTSQVQDVQSSVDNAVQSMFRDVEKASCTYQTKLTETKDHLTERVGDLEHRLDSVAASQLNLCTPVVDSMKKLQDETRYATFRRHGDNLSWIPFACITSTRLFCIFTGSKYP